MELENWLKIVAESDLLNLLEVVFYCLRPKIFVL